MHNNFSWLAHKFDGHLIFVHDDMNINLNTVHVSARRHTQSTLRFAMQRKYLPRKRAYPLLQPAWVMVR
jgi:hypothetical protein